MIQRGEIYLVNLTKNVGSEQGGIRPAVIIQNDKGNENSPTTVVCPLTSKKKSYIPTHVVLYPQPMTIDKSLLLKLIGKVASPTKMNEVNEKLMISLGILAV